MDNSEIQSEKWYQTRAGVIMLVFIGIFSVLLIGFGSLTGYYIFQLQLGNQEELVSKFTNNPRFTKAGNNAIPASATISQNIQNYISDDNPQTGNSQSPATLMMFIDFECPFCQEAFPAIQRIKERFDGTINIIFKHYPLDNIHPQAVLAAQAATCAQEQDSFWDYYEILFEEKNFHEEQLLSYANQLGLNEENFKACLTSQKYQSIIEQDIQDGIALEIRGTPTYILNDKKIEGVYTEGQWNTLIIDELSKL